MKMAKLINPALFSQYFGISSDILDREGFVDPILNCDTKLFIDPLLLSTSKFDLINKNGLAAIKHEYGKVIKLLRVSQSKGDKAWRDSYKYLSLDERAETGLGYGGSSTSGSSRSDEIKQKILSTAKEIINLGEDDPEVISLMGLFEEGIGPDTISDMTTNFILPYLCELTEIFCQKYRIKVRKYIRYGDRWLPENPFSKKHHPVILVPKDIVRELPIAVDWSDVSRVVEEIDEIRTRVNALLAGIAHATVSDKKNALKEAALSSLDNFRAVFEALKGASNNYDPNEDVLNFYAFRKIISEDPGKMLGFVQNPKVKSKQSLEIVVMDIIQNFKNMVENNNLWEMMWNDNRPKRERAAQLLFFATAYAACKANDVDISPETNMGGGPVDFKFSTGYSNKLLVEVKLSKGTVEHGYTKQLEIYKQASETDAGIFLIVDVGGMGRKLAKIRGVQKLREAAGLPASQIIVVNAKRQASASKRK